MSGRSQGAQKLFGTFQAAKRTEMTQTLVISYSHPQVTSLGRVLAST